MAVGLSMRRCPSQQSSQPPRWPAAARAAARVFAQSPIASTTIRYAAAWPITCGLAMHCHDLTTGAGRHALISRRLALMVAGIALPLSSSRRPATASARGNNLEATARDSGPSEGMVYCRPDGSLWELQRPKWWREVSGLDPSGSVKASFYSEEAKGETIALYSVPDAVASTQELGSPQEVGSALASAAPDCELLSAEAVTDDSTGQTYYLTHILYGGVSAGLFKEVHELRSITVFQGRRYTCRATATSARWGSVPALKTHLQTAVDSFRITTNQTFP